MRIVHGTSAAARRSLRLLPESRSILVARMNGDSPWIFPSPVKPGAHITKVNNAHARVLEDTGLNFVIYDFRHTAATRWAERGMPLATLSKILGHSNLRSVMKYVHPSQEHMDEALLRFGGSENPAVLAMPNPVGIRSVTSVKKGDSAGLSVNEHEGSAPLQLIENKGQIQ
jgi:integrase